MPREVRGQITYTSPNLNGATAPHFLMDVITYPRWD